MKIRRDDLQGLVFGGAGSVRFTQDSPVMPDVWFGFGADPAGRLDLLMEPKRGVQPGKLAQALRALGETDGKAAKGAKKKSARAYRIASDENNAVAELDLITLTTKVLPLSSWWDTHARGLAGLSAAQIKRACDGEAVEGVTEYSAWLLRLVGSLLWAGEQKGNGYVKDLPSNATISRRLAALVKDVRSSMAKKEGRREALLWSVNRNREAKLAIWNSTATIKSDAAARLFPMKCDNLTWAVLDTGIDACHPALRKRDSKGKLEEMGEHPEDHSRVVATYDFTRVRQLLDGDAELPADLGERPRKRAPELRRRLLNGQAIDWELLEEFLRVDHGAGYRPPGHSHGTHVAGILGADWRTDDPGYSAESDKGIIGVCPDIRLLDLRVLNDKGEGDEFSILAALQFIRFKNARSRRPDIQGANLSLSIPHDVANFACGRTPVCQEAERLHSSGVVVVAAAGNEGYVHYMTTAGAATEAYRNISVTDPGNAEPVITVGSTHRSRPHTYGVSYFSSRGPTGDGRMKPDLVAPGEKIIAPVPGGGTEAKDGTSMAAPHVSGAAALIMSRHPEFIGDPERIKRVLCATATDLGRERYFQGAGLVDICRALQSL